MIFPDLGHVLADLVFTDYVYICLIFISLLFIPLFFDILCKLCTQFTISRSVWIPYGRGVCPRMMDAFANNEILRIRTLLQE
jgi:hypothetical protein